MIAAATFGAGTNHDDAWTPFRHPVIRRTMRSVPAAAVDGATTSCGGWFLADAVTRAGGPSPRAFDPDRAMNDRGVVVVLAAATLVALAAACLVGSVPPRRGPGGGGPPGRRLGRRPRGSVGDRLPRAVAALAVGAALGASGAALQGLLRNPLAEPGVLGVSATAALGATFVIYYGLGSAGGFRLARGRHRRRPGRHHLLDGGRRPRGLGGDAHPGGDRAVELRRRADGVADESRAAPLLPVRHAELDAGHRGQPEL